MNDMIYKELLLSRRRLLQFGAGALCLPFIGTLLGDELSIDTSEVTTDGLRLVLIELSGANDGLNTVIPYSDERYFDLRPNLSVSNKDRIALDADYAFHHGLTNMMDLWEDGELAVVHGLGYPKPNRSHFKSIAIWESGGDGKGHSNEGWITHAIEHAYATDFVDAHGISFGGTANIFASAQGNWLSLKSARELLMPLHPLVSGSRSDVITSATKSANAEAIELVRQRTAQLETSLKRFRGRLRNSSQNASIKGRRLGSQLNHVVNLVDAGVNTPVYKVSLPGFDTHDNQPRRHQKLLQELADGIAGLRDELRIRDEWDRTLVVTYSEFGRRARENRSMGTDHGTAAVHFVTGGAVHGGFYGDHPDLGSLVNEDMQFTMDYRALYHHILDSWLNVDSGRYAQYQDPRLVNLLG